MKKSRIEKMEAAASAHSHTRRLVTFGSPHFGNGSFFDMNTIQCHGLSAGCHHGEKGERDESSPVVGV
jgi:hypothetical protein